MANGSNNIKSDVMKRYILFYAIAVTSLLASCHEDDITNTTTTHPAEVGEEILFGVRAGFENATPDTRTVYSGETYVVGGKTYERINWVHDVDKIHIYSPEASVPSVGSNPNDKHSSHYTVKRSDNSATAENDEAYLKRLHDTALHWGEGSDEAGTHTFYAMYPSSQMFVNSDGSTAIQPEHLQTINMNGTEINGYIDNEQKATVTYNNGSYVASPDMRYAYMVAKATATRDAAYEVDETGCAKGIDLTFFPIVTAMEIEMFLPESTNKEKTNPVTIAKVSVAGNDIAGSFTCNIGNNDDWATDASLLSTGFNGEIYSGNTKHNEVTIWTTYGPNNLPLTLNPGERLTFTVFLKPTSDFENLRVGVISDFIGEQAKYKSLSGITIVARKKNIFTNLQLHTTLKPNEEDTIDYSNWMRRIKDETSMKELSLPGTGNSFSYLSNNPNHKAQQLTFDKQWAAGIRVFELSTDRNILYSRGLGSTEVECGKEDIKENDSVLTLSDVFDRILNKLALNPHETAMLILTYQPSDNERRGPSYMYQLNSYINTLDADRLVLFSPDLKMGGYNTEDINPDGSIKDGAISSGARGKLMVVVRPNQRDEQDRPLIGGIAAVDNDRHWQNILEEISGTTAEKLLVVNGCGTGKDKWGARGYKIDNNCVPDISNSFHAPNLIEAFMNNGYIFGEYDKNPQNYVYKYTSKHHGNYTISRPYIDDTEALNFGYTTNHSNITCWFQEWARVIETNVNYRSSIYWFESYKEKLSNVKTTFDMAVSGKYATHGYTFINSLCGYLANSSVTESITPSIGWIYGGAYGNIGALATKLNQDFYSYVLEKRQQMIAPTGIVLMDFISDSITHGNEGAYWLPQLIIGNNYSLFKVNDSATPTEP